ncbi:MAG: right-handed parallel beta-helix repeat-containing protein [Pseudomonadota bacterium]
MKKITISILKTLSIALAQAFVVSAAYALPTQTWVSGFGNDLNGNTCTFTSPCKTFAYALNQTAAGGEISIDSPGEFGVVTINKSITINALGALGSIVVPSGANGITVAAAPTDIVILRGLTINGGGVGANGISFTSGGRLHVENCTIYRMVYEGIQFSPSAVSALFVNNLSVRSNTTGAIYIAPQATGSAVVNINNLKSEANARAVRADDRSTVIVRNSIASGTFAGSNFSAVSLANGIVNYTLENSTASDAPNGGVYVSGTNATMQISNVTSTRNGTGLLILNGGKIISSGNNRVFGNLIVDGTPTLVKGQL